MLINYTDIELVEGCKENNRNLQKVLYDRYKDAMFTICKRILPDDDLACDALQEGFVEVFRSIKSFRLESTLGAWIKVIVIRKALHLAKRYTPIVELEEHHQQEAIHWDSSLTGKALNRAIENLPTGYRKVFVLVEVEGYSHRETAAMLGISEGTSKSQLYHSKRLLQQQLATLKN